MSGLELVLGVLSGLAVVLLPASAFPIIRGLRRWDRAELLRAVAQAKAAARVSITDEP